MHILREGERERERCICEREREMHVWMCVCVCTCVYIYIHRERDIHTLICNDIYIYIYTGYACICAMKQQTKQRLIPFQQPHPQTRLRLSGERFLHLTAHGSMGDENHGLSSKIFGYTMVPLFWERTSNNQPMWLRKTGQTSFNKKWIAIDVMRPALFPLPTSDFNEKPRRHRRALPLVPQKPGSQGRVNPQ